jgi:hypothetical protein
MYSAKSMASFVRDDLPFHSVISAIDNIGSNDGFCGSSITGLASACGRRIRLYSVFHASLT